MVVVPGVISLITVSLSVSEIESLTVESVMGMLVDPVDSLVISDPLTLFSVTVLLVENAMTSSSWLVCENIWCDSGRDIHFLSAGGFLSWG